MYGLYTSENVDIFGWPLSKYSINKVVNHFQVFLELAHHQLEEGQEEEEESVPGLATEDQSSSNHTSPTHNARTLMAMHSQLSKEESDQASPPWHRQTCQTSLPQMIVQWYIITISWLLHVLGMQWNIVYVMYCLYIVPSAMWK